MRYVWIDAARNPRRSLARVMLSISGLSEARLAELSQNGGASETQTNHRSVTWKQTDHSCAGISDGMEA
jgi:hypothetical protein